MILLSAEQKDKVPGAQSYEARRNAEEEEEKVKERRRRTRSGGKKKRKMSRRYGKEFVGKNSFGTNTRTHIPEEKKRGLSFWIGVVAICNVSPIDATLAFGVYCASESRYKNSDERTSTLLHFSLSLEDFMLWQKRSRLGLVPAI